MRRTRITLFCVTVALICLGLVMIYSASSIYAWENYKDSAFFLKRQLLYVILGAIGGFFTLSFDYALLRKAAKPLMVFSVFLLLLLLLPGISREVSGARRWFRLGLIGFQPSELAILTMIIYVSDFISRKKGIVRDFYSGFLPPVMVLGFVTLLIFLQPDFGTAVGMGTVTLIIIFLGGARLAHLGSILLAAFPFLYVLVFSVPYRRARIMSFLNPWLDPKGSGFQIIQSQIALGSGGLFGVGLGEGKQKLFYLPAAHTDFIFSIIGEELGFLGTMAVVILFVTLIWQGVNIARNSPDLFGCLLSVGVTSMLAFKAFINIGVSCGILPTKGLPLPFISYGGSSLLFDMIGVAILLNVAKHAEI
ncbi:MAG: putative lipid II flippase FtsW [Candidatus Omnitrophica bacterium]|nr:putative lipid II flippase FtsW [Candidatus Omnitrophota bacterium]